MTTDKMQVETTGRELLMRRIFDAPRERVFAAYSSCEHLRHWWGPREWRMLIRIPEFVNGDAVKQAIDQVLVKKQLNAAADIELYSMTEGKAVQIMHTGPFENEPESGRPDPPAIDLKFALAGTP